MLNPLAYLRLVCFQAHNLPQTGFDFAFRTRQDLTNATIKDVTHLTAFVVVASSVLLVARDEQLGCLLDALVVGLLYDE